MGTRHQQGFTYVALLIIVALIGAGLAAKGVSWKNAGQREKEAELLFIGQEFREAIALYYFRSPGQAQDYPKSLEELTADTRFSNTQRYLRRIYRDPMTGRPNWGLVLSPSGRIMGVHSLSRDRPLKTANFSEADQEFSGSGSYSDWQFVFVPVATFSTPVQAGSPR
jgi:type II secretory pathway pseudopilin PulG